MSQQYCRECGDRIVNGEAHQCSEAGLNAMRRNPLLALLMDSEGHLNLDAPVILGGGPTSSSPSAT